MYGSSALNGVINVRTHSEEQKDLHARVLAQYGSFFLTSDNMGDYDREQREHYRQLRELWQNKDWTDRHFLDWINKYK